MAETEAQARVRLAKDLFLWCHSGALRPDDEHAQWWRFFWNWMIEKERFMDTNTELYVASHTISFDMGLKSYCRCNMFAIYDGFSMIGSVIGAGILISSRCSYDFHRFTEMFRISSCPSPPSSRSWIVRTSPSAWEIAIPCQAQRHLACMNWS